MKPVRVFFFIGALLAAAPLGAQTSVKATLDEKERAVMRVKANALKPTLNYDEAKVAPYVLPDPLVLSSGEKVTDAATWWQKRRPEILRLFEDEIYGRAPSPPRSIAFRVRSVDKTAYGGKATRKLVTVFLLGNTDGPALELVLYLPNNRPGPAPVFLALNYGSHTINRDPAIPIAANWLRDRENALTFRGAPPASPHDVVRGGAATRWPIERILDRGYGLVTAYYGDLAPDINDGFKHGIQRWFYRPGQTLPAPDEWGFISAWAWGFSRAMDYLQQDQDVDARRVAITGHSRLGKTTLWAGALDPRFALVVSSCSGHGGAALSRRNFGETTEWAVLADPDRYAANYRRFSRNESALPVDQHMLVALIAPRPVYIISATEDGWADPKGEFLGAKGADLVYRLLGTDGFAAEEMPAPEQPVMSTIGYHIHTGLHDVTPYDWERTMDFADRHLPKSME